VRYFVLGDYGLSLSYLYQVVVIAGAITLGFGLGDLINTALYCRHRKEAQPFSQLKGWKKRD
ncbi:MAG: threonine/serine exporter, partial [Limosilactobacillus fermentum]